MINLWFSQDLAQPQGTFCVITFEPIKIQTCSAPQNDHLNLSFVKNDHTYGEKMARNGRKTVIYEEHSFQISLYVPGQLY